MKKSKKKKIVWFARGKYIARMGPYDSQIEASKNIMSHLKDCISNSYPTVDCNCCLTPAENAFVWPEEI